MKVVIAMAALAQAVTVTLAFLGLILLAMS